jgi:phospholipase/carboxylesterase
MTTLDGPEMAPAAGGAPTSLVVLLHGYGSNGQDLIGLAPYWRAALPHTQFLSPNARQPCPYAPGGYQWWDLVDRSAPARAAGVREAAPDLDAYLDEQLARFGLTPDRLALVGFSQGTMMALHVGPRRDPAVAGIVGYSGLLADPDTAAAETRTLPPILLVHGGADMTLPVEALHHAEGALRPLGFDVQTHISPSLGHSIDEAGLTLGQDFLVKQLAP